MRIAVIGAGVVGLAVAEHLIRVGGHEIRCYEAGTPMGARSVGDTRIFRILHADPRLMELAVRARVGWDDWSARAGVELVRPHGLFSSGLNLEDRASVMRDLGVPAAVVSGTDELSPLTSHRVDESLLHDPWAGTTLAYETGQYLLSACESLIVNERVTRIESADTSVTLHSASGAWKCDSVVVAAGSGTSNVAAMFGLRLPINLFRITRFTFRMHDADAIAPCWFDEFNGRHVWGLTVKRGHWAMGAALPSDKLRIELSAEAVSASTLDELTTHIHERLDRLHIEPLDAIPCVSEADDGINLKRDGRVLCVWGDNLFKFAPVLGAELAQAAVSLDVPQLPTLEP